MSETSSTGSPGGHPRPECFCAGAGPLITEFLRRLGPPEQARAHFTQARVEFLKGLRAILDYRIEECGKSKEKGTSVPVE